MEIERTLDARQLGTPLGEALFGRVALLVGFGSIGRELAPRLRAFGLRILAVRGGAWPDDDRSACFGRIPVCQTFLKGSCRRMLVDEAETYRGGGKEGLVRLASRSDVVVVCCPLTQETSGLVDSAVRDQSSCRLPSAARVQVRTCT